MSKEILVAKLQTLARGEQHRSMTARLREVLPELENTLAAGVRIEAVVKALNECGFEISIGSFKTILYRLRQKRLLQSNIRKSQELSKPILPPPPAETQLEEEQEEETPPAVVSSNPGDLDTIINSVPDLDSLARIGKGKRKAQTTKGS